MIIINIYQLLKFYLANSRLGHIVFRKQSYINNDRNNNPSKMQHFYQQKHKKKKMKLPIKVINRKPFN